MQLLQTVDHQLLLVGKDVSIDVQCRRNGFVSHAVCDIECREAGIDEQGNVGMAQVVRADRFDSGGLAAPFQLEEQIVCRTVKQAAARSDMGHADVDAYFIQQKLRDVHVTDTFPGLWGGDDVPAVDTGVGFCDADPAVAHVDVLRRESQQFSLTHAGPVEDLKGGECLRISREMADELFIFLQRPEIQLFCARTADMPCFSARIRKIVVSLGIVHECGQLGIKQPLVRVAVVLL